MTKVYVADVTPLEEEAVFRCFYHRAPVWRREKIDALRFPKDRRLCLGAWVLLEKALEEWGVSGSPDWTWGEYGKPFLKDCPGIQFSLSHSGSRVLCALSTGAVGCDIQQTGSGNPALADRFFSPAEAAYLKAEGRETDFYRLWTLKESFVKAVGLGLSLPLKEFTLDLSGESPALLHAPFPGKTFFFREFPAEAGYACACCAETPEIAGLIWRELK